MKRLLTSATLFLCSLLTFALFSGSGSGTENDPYLILNPIHLNQMRNFLNQSGVYFKLMADIDLTEFLEDENPTQGWQPVGNSSAKFNGILDGNSHTISGLWINRPNTDYVGLFGYTYYATIKNLIIEDASIKGKQYVGVLSGYGYGDNNKGIIQDCVISGEVNGESYTGGCVGETYSTSISGVYSTVNVKGNDYIGGITGKGYIYTDKILISSCYILSNIEGNNSVGGIVGNHRGGNMLDCSFIGSISGNNSVGGICGETSYNSGLFTSCYSAATIRGNNGIGGIIGQSKGSRLEDCYFSGLIKGLNNTGGLIGKMSGGYIKHCYAFGNVSGASNVGGLCGYATYNGGGYIKSSVIIATTLKATDGIVGRIYGYKDSDFTIGAIGSSEENKSYNRTIVISQGVAQEITDDLQNGTGVSASTLKLKATYVGMGWDFNDTWAIQETECYPYMQRQTAPPVILSDIVSGATTISGKCIDGGLITLEIDGIKQQMYSTNHEFSFNVSPLQAGHEVRVSAKADDKEQSYFTTETVNYLGKGTEADPYQIYTAADLTGVYRKGYFKLMNDIDLTEYINQFSPTEGWESIGREGSETIHFDGNEHKITGLWCNSTRNNTGLFSCFANGTIKNLTVETADGKQVKGGSNTGILIGKMMNGTIENCHVKGTVADGTPVGGMVGLMDGGTIYRSESSVTITTQNANTYIGGLVGEMTSGEIDQCYTTGTLTGSGSESYVGGLVGKNSATVTNSYSEATISSSYNAAGLIAYNYGVVDKCYAMGDLFSYNYAAGVIGYNDGANAVISNCVAMNNKIDIVYESQQTQQGGGYGQRIIGGIKNNAPAPEMNNYALKTMQLSVNDVPQKVYDDIMNGTAKTSDELKLQSTYESIDWDFSGVWAMNANTFLPYLQWSNPDRTEQTLSLTQLPTMTYGDLAYQLPTNTEEGLPLTWTSSNTSIATVNGNMLTIRKTGSIVVSCSQEGNGDYFPFNKSFPLTINKANLRITADSHAIHQGEEIPELTVQYEGFKYNEDATCLTTQPSVTTSATSTSAIGNYPIIVSGAEAVNYDISYVNGTLSVVDETTLNNTLYSGTVEIRSGGNASISLELNNEDPIIMVEFFMQLPEGISISVDEDGYLATLNSNRSNRHIIDVEKNSDGLYHFLVYSSRNNSFKENEGELINIKVECEESMEGGTYQAMLRNILLNDADKNEIVLPDYNFSMHVTDVLLGDVNGDWKINGSDIVEMVDHIMGRPSDTFILAAAELTGDGLVNGSDLVEEISLVMSQGISQAPASVGSHAPMLLASGLALNTNQDGEAVLSVESGEDYILTQMTLHLSEGQHLNEIMTDSRHSVEYLQVAEGTYFVLCYSSSNSAFCSNEELLNIHYTGEGVITVNDVMMVGTDRRETCFAPANLNGTTGIEWASRLLEQPTDIYSINGYMVKQQATTLKGLSKGVYLINGKKIIIK